MITSTHFVIAVHDLDATIRWWEEVLGFEARDMGDEGWRMLVRGAAVIMAGECPTAVPLQEIEFHSYFAYLVEDGDIDACFQRAKSAGAIVRKEIRDEPWGMREFALETVDGHRLTVGKSLD